MQRDYQRPELRELRDQQIRFTPRVTQLPQVEAAERLIAEIDSEKAYPYEYVCFRVTGYRPTEPAPTKNHGRRPAARFAVVRRGSVGFCRYGCRQHRRASADG